MLRDQLVPSCKLEVRRAPSTIIPNKTVSLGQKCFVCRSKLGKRLRMHKSAACDTYCYRCRKWMHQDCQYLYQRHTATEVEGVRNELNSYEDSEEDQRMSMIIGIFNCVDFIFYFDQDRLRYYCIIYCFFVCLQ